MAKRENKGTAAEDYFARLSWQRGRAYKRLPARGEAEEPSWEYKPVYPQKKMRLSWFDILFILPLAGAAVAVVMFWRQALGIGLVIILITVGLAKGIDAWNKYLRADDIEDHDPKH
jgi:hypothetical protein